MRKLLSSNQWAWLLFGFSALLCALRFVDLGAAPFINDEPQLQLLLDIHLRNHSIPLLGLMGTHGVHYGPTALWFYLPIRFFTDHLNTILTYYAAVMIAGYAILVATVWKSAGKEVAAWIAAFIAASPYLFFYSRLAWDNTFLIPLIAAVCFSVVWIDRQLDRLPWALLGLAGGLIVNLHLMALPVLVAAVATLAPTLIGRLCRPAARKATLQGILIAAVISSAVVAPYLFQVMGGISAGDQFNPTLPHIGSGLRYLPRYFSWTAMQYFLEGPKDFRTMVFGGGFVTALFHIDPSYCLRAAAWILIPLTAWRMITRYRSVNTIARMAFFSIVFLVLYYGGVSIDMNHPHYILPIWWVMFFFGASAIVQSRGYLGTALKAAGVLTLLMNLVFIVASHAWIEKNHGTRGTHYTPLHSELEGAVAGICADIVRRHAADPDASEPVPVWLDFQGVVGIFPFPVEYYFRHEPECAGRVISLQADQPVAGLQRYRLYYRDSDELSAALAWARIP
jgi:hypothetical protein